MMQGLFSLLVFVLLCLLSYFIRNNGKHRTFVSNPILLEYYTEIAMTSVIHYRMNLSIPILETSRNIEKLCR